MPHINFNDCKNESYDFITQNRKRMRSRLSPDVKMLSLSVF